ncbi:alpha/beta hydrolase [Actinocorallia sp. B10E7]|uniref:alpha/beta fold hydrolase n=1 Tax=Actinocorallia sp. B10E7 TaxID=3153558 RepID=UPI00325EBB89
MTDAFFAAYEVLLRRWPADVESFDLPSPYGRTRVHACGRRDAPPLLLIPGGGSTSTVWSLMAEPLARSHRVYAVDLLGDAGHSVAQGRPMRTVTDAMSWLDAVIDRLEVPATHVCGHSYGGWLALAYAMHAPHRVDRLILLDPTDCFVGMSPRYLLRALPSLLMPSPARVRSFLRWETAGSPVDQDWLEVAALAAQLPQPHIVMPKRPDPDDLRRVAAPALVLLAERSRCHDISKVAAAASQSLPAATVAVVPGASHHGMPTGDPHGLAQRMLDFLAKG